MQFLHNGKAGALDGPVPLRHGQPCSDLYWSIVGEIHSCLEQRWIISWIECAEPGDKLCVPAAQQAVTQAEVLHRPASLDLHIRDWQSHTHM